MNLGIYENYKVGRDIIAMYARELSWQQREELNYKQKLKHDPAISFLDKTIRLEQVNQSQWKLIYYSGAAREIMCEYVFDFQEDLWWKDSTMAEEKMTMAAWELHDKIYEAEGYTE